MNYTNILYLIFIFNFIYANELNVCEFHKITEILDGIYSISDICNIEIENKNPFITQEEHKKRIKNSLDEDTFMRFLSGNTNGELVDIHRNSKMLLKQLKLNTEINNFSKVVFNQLKMFIRLKILAIQKKIDCLNENYDIPDKYKSLIEKEIFKISPKMFEDHRKKTCKNSLKGLETSIKRDFHNMRLYMALADGGSSYHFSKDKHFTPYCQFVNYTLEDIENMLETDSSRIDMFMNTNISHPFYKQEYLNKFKAANFKSLSELEPLNAKEIMEVFDILNSDYIDDVNDYGIELTQSNIDSKIEVDNRILSSDKTEYLKAQTRCSKSYYNHLKDRKYEKKYYKVLQNNPIIGYIKSPNPSKDEIAQAFSILKHNTEYLLKAVSATIEEINFKKSNNYKCENKLNVIINFLNALDQIYIDNLIEHEILKETDAKTILEDIFKIIKEFDDKTSCQDKLNELTSIFLGILDDMSIRKLINYGFLEKDINKFSFKEMSDIVEEIHIKKSYLDDMSIQNLINYGFLEKDETKFSFQDTTDLTEESFFKIYYKYISTIFNKNKLNNIVEKSKSKTFYKRQCENRLNKMVGVMDVIDEGFINKLIGVYKFLDEKDCRFFNVINGQSQNEEFEKMMILAAITIGANLVVDYLGKFGVSPLIRAFMKMPFGLGLNAYYLYLDHRKSEIIFAAVFSGVDDQTTLKELMNLSDMELSFIVTLISFWFATGVPEIIQALDMSPKLKKALLISRDMYIKMGGGL